MTRHRPHPSPRTEDGRVLVSRAIAARLSGLPERQLRARVPAVACDVKSRAALLDLDEVDAAAPARVA